MKKCEREREREREWEREGGMEWERERTYFSIFLDSLSLITLSLSLSLSLITQECGWIAVSEHCTSSGVDNLANRKLRSFVADATSTFGSCLSAINRQVTFLWGGAFLNGCDCFRTW
jgi:hypothetical protein